METLPEFSLVRPQTVEEAVAAILAKPDCRFLGGGTDLIVNMRRGLASPANIVDVTGIDELNQLSCDDIGLTIGAATTLQDIGRHHGIRSRFSSVSDACDVIAGPSHRAVATVGGNLCLDTRCIYYNQSDWWRAANSYCLKYKGEICHVAPQGNRCRAAYCGDLAPALLVLDAEVTIAGPEGRRRLALAELYRDDGADYLQLCPGELVVAVHVPAGQAGVVTHSAYHKIRVRGAIDFPLAGVAVACRGDTAGSIAINIAVTGTNSRPIVIKDIGMIEPGPDLSAELGRLEKLVQKQVSPQRTTIAAAHYRRLAAAAMAAKLTGRLINRLCET